MTPKRLTTQQRQDIFRDLVLTQDTMPNVSRSRQMIAEKYAIDEAQVRRIEDEGIDNEWPPLNEAPPQRARR